MKLGYVILFVPDVSKACAFYERAFALEPGFAHEAGDYAEMKTGGTTLAFTSHRLAASAVPLAYRPLEAEAEPPGIEITLITTEVASAFAQAVSAGATPVAEPHETSWGQVVSYVRDPHGALVGLASPVGSSS